MLVFISQYASMIGFVVQVAYYIIVAIAALWAAITFSKYVKFMTTEEIEVESTEAGESGEDVDVDKFVE